MNVETAATDRERQILDLVLAGSLNKQIAANLGLSVRTVENHRYRAMQKLGAHSLPELVRAALSVEAAGARIAGLTERRRQILGLVLAGKTGKSIAADLGLNRRTVEAHLAGIKQQTASRSRAELIRVALSAAQAAA